MTRAFIFPGQGSQAVGMGRVMADAFVPARAVFDEVDDALNQRLSRLMWDGPDSDLTLTANAQPAIMSASVAVFRVLQSECGLDLTKHARLVAGHSLGEYSALCAAGAFTLADTARLLRIRGEAMQDAVPSGKGGMSALLGVDVETAEAVCKEVSDSNLVVVANDNAPGQIVISGEKAAVEKAGELARTRGAKRVIPLAVSAPFHSPFMKPAADRMRAALSEVIVRPLAVPVLSNVTATETNDPNVIRARLVDQVTGRIRWRESVASFRSLGVEATVECGGNKVLTGMVKRIDKELQTMSIDTPADIEALARTF